jgi:nicotinamidase-related amidase
MRYFCVVQKQKGVADAMIEARSTVHDAFFLGYDVVVPVECVAATSPQAQATSLYDIETHYGTVTPLAEVLALLKAQREA